MKRLFSKFIILIILAFTLCFSCEKFKTSDLGPGISIYKTNGNYFNLTTVGMKENRIFRVYSYSEKIDVIDDDTIYKYRKKLQDGFVLDAEADERYDVFLSLSVKKYIEMENTLNTFCLPDDTLKKYIFDKDPYIEFYRNKTDVKRFFLSDSLEIMEIIRNDSIDKYFEKLK